MSTVVVKCVCLSYLYLVVAWCAYLFFFLMIRRPPRSTLDRSSAASDVYKRQVLLRAQYEFLKNAKWQWNAGLLGIYHLGRDTYIAVSYTHLRAHETVLDLVCRLLLEKKKTIINK